MFLSVIVSCHNCKPYIKRLLNSLVIQDFNDMEVIIMDDNSTDNFLELVESYKMLLDIKCFNTESHKYHCPGNTRMDGITHTSGEWITFMDHDDEFLPNAFNTVYSQLKVNSKYNIPFVFSPVQRVDKNGNTGNLDAITWLHGNFYKKSFLIENNINFKEDLLGNEDLYFNNQVNNHVHGQGLSILKVHDPLYKWHYNEQSFSNTSSEGLGYTERYFGDYLIANSEPHILCYNLYPDKQEQYRQNLIQTLLYTYFYYQRASFNHGEEKLTQMLSDIKDTFNKIKLTLNISTKDLLKIYMSDVPRFNDSRNTISSLSGTFIESKSICQFYNEL